MASPFAPTAPSELARRAAEALQSRLRDGDFARALELGSLDGADGGKMFGVLVVAAPGGRVGYLCAFSGMLAGRWFVDGFVPPLFDPAARAAFWPDGEAALGELTARLDALDASRDAVATAAALPELMARHAGLRSEQRQQQRARREQRHAQREQLRQLALPADQQADALWRLDQASRADSAERRRLEGALRTELAGQRELAAALGRSRVTLEQLRAARSRQLSSRLLDGYRIANARDERRPLSELFAPSSVPGGAGDCAGPKLIGYAHARRLRPLALAEFWWGATPLSGGRHAGAYYPACRGKCGPILPFMLGGLPVEPAPRIGGGAIAEDEPALVFEDEWLMIVDKPCGLLAEPGRDAGLNDSVAMRLRRRWPEAPALRLVHRLDLDTSGLLLVAKDAASHAALQRLFARREVEKRYAAWLDGELTRERGVVNLPLRVDLEDRPRQIHDPLRGRPAITEWQVIARSGARTRVALYPRTGRTHQLRLHAAHPLGLDAPVVGDRLYGRPGGRLLLHAESLAFNHPRTGRRLTIERPAPF